MQTTTVPPKLAPGDEVRVIAPSRSRAVVLEHDHSALVEQRFAAMGLRLTYGAHVDERDAFDSAAIASRVHDLHEAFADPQVRGVLTVIGGFNTNEILPHLDFDLVAANPKILCGYSDITALQGAVLARTGLVTYSSPHWSSFGMRDHAERTVDWFRRALLQSEPFDLEPSELWTDDPWFLDQDDRHPMANPGPWSIQPGEAEGRVVGTNLCTLNLLQGTPYMPSLDGALLVLEDDEASSVADVARNLTSLLQLPDAAGIRGLVVGRFQRRTAMTRELLTEIVARQPVLSGLPVLAGVDVGHTMPLATIAIGGTVRVSVGESSRLRMVRF